LFAPPAGFQWVLVRAGGPAPPRAAPDGSEEAALVLGGVARFLAAHTPTRRELATVVSLAARLRRGESLTTPQGDPVSLSD
jgi:hypothetical protein